MSPEREKILDEILLKTAENFAVLSHARRSKVGAVLYNNSNIISMGWNGMPAGHDNNCEIENLDGTLTTRPEVLHAESNVLMKLVAGGGRGAEGSTMYVTMSPCPECAKLIIQAKVARVVYREKYRLTAGIDMLMKYKIQVDQIKRK